jgi:hypothetical protein
MTAKPLFVGAAASSRATTPAAIHDSSRAVSQRTVVARQSRSGSPAPGPRPLAPFFRRPPAPGPRPFIRASSGPAPFFPRRPASR